MNIKIRETGEERELNVIDPNTGVEWTQDLIGNAGGFVQGQFVWSEEDNAYLASQTEYDWWAQYIADTEQTNQEMQELVDELDISWLIINERIVEAMTGINDYDDHRRVAAQVIAELREEYADREEDE